VPIQRAHSGDGQPAARCTRRATLDLTRHVSSALLPEQECARCVDAEENGRRLDRAQGDGRFLANKDARTLAEDLLALNQEEFSAAFRKSPMKRAKRAGLQRSARVVLGHANAPGDADAS